MTWDFCTSLYLSSYITPCHRLSIYTPLFRLVHFCEKTLAYECLAPTAARSWTACRTDTSRRCIGCSYDPRGIDGGASSQERRYDGRYGCDAWKGTLSTSESNRSMERLCEQTVESGNEVLESGGELMSVSKFRVVDVIRRK